MLRVDFDFSSDDLVLLGSNLQFFTCNRFLPGNSGRTAASLLRQFPNLQGFKSAFPYMDDQRRYIHSWIRELLRLNRSVCAIESEAALSEEIVKLLAMGGTKCLHFLGNWTDPPPFSLSQSLAESLVELSVKFEPTVKFFPFPLPNLLYLTVTCGHEDTLHHLSPIVSAPSLRFFTYKGPYSPKSTNLSQLKSFVHHFDQLRVLSIQMDNSYSPGVKISLPTGLEKLTFNIQKSELLEYASPSLMHLMVGCGTSFTLACPSLKVLICEQFRLRSESMPGLLHSLSKCVTLVKFRLTSQLMDDSVSLRPLIDLLSSMKQLTHLELRHFGSRIVAPAYYHDGIDFDEKKFPSLGYLQLQLLPTEITLHLTSSFTVCLDRWPDDAIIFKGPNKIYLVNGSHVRHHQTKN